MDSHAAWSHDCPTALNQNMSSSLWDVMKENWTNWTWNQTLSFWLTGELQSASVLSGGVSIRQQSFQAWIWVFVTVRQSAWQTGSLHQETLSASSSFITTERYRQWSWRKIQTSLWSVSCRRKTRVATWGDGERWNPQSVWCQGGVGHRCVHRRSRWWHHSSGRRDSSGRQRHENKRMGGDVTGVRGPVQVDGVWRRVQLRGNFSEAAEVNLNQFLFS